MHDLVHDLAQHVAGEEIILVDVSREQLGNRLVHVSFCAGDPQSLFAARNLRSFLLRKNDITATTFEELLLRFRSLRALKSNSIEIVPGSIRRLRHLRYLNLSHSHIKVLPRAITELDNLKTLDLDYCKKLRVLPRGFTKLANLSHLGILECPFTDIPLSFGRMKSLRELNRFIIGQNNGLDALADLNLRGRLGIECRKWRTDTVLEAKAANLKEKKHLTSLSFCFQYQGEQPPVATRDELLLLESLQLPPGLKYLHFSGLECNSFPRGMLYESAKLVQIYIQRCSSCQMLPLFCQLPSLKHLSFEGLKALEYVEADTATDTDSEPGSAPYFPALESLTLNFLSELKKWSRVEKNGNCIFPRLRRLQIFCCPKLTTLPFTPQLESLIVWSILGELLKVILTSNETPTLKYLRMESVELISMNLRDQYLITELSIENCGSLRNISDGMHYLSVLEELRIYNCEDLDAWDTSAWEGLKSLHTLQLSDISKLELLPHGITCLPTLQHLSITGLENLTVLPQHIGTLLRLQNLAIIGCPRLTSLPESLMGLTCLQKLVILECPDLQKRCQGPEGEYWPLIRHIPTVSLQMFL